MSITCQVTELKADRICLHVPDIAAQPETSQFLMQYLLGLPGVAGVEMRPANSSAVILHDGRMKTRAAILDALRGKQPAAGLQSAAADVVPDDRAGESISQASEATSQAAAQPFARCEVLHAMRGRVRLRIPVLRTEPALAGVLAHHMEQQAGVQQVRLNARAANLIVAFDPALLDAQTVAARVAAYDPEPAAVARWEADQAAQQQLPALHGPRRKVEMALVAAALVVGLIGGGSATLLVYALLFGAIGSILQRTYRSLFKDRRLTVEALAAGAMVALILTGRAWLAALVPMLLFGAVWLRARNQARGTAVEDAAHARAASEVISVARRGPATSVAVIDGADDGAAGPVVLETPGVHADDPRAPVTAHVAGLGAFVGTLVLSLGAAQRARKDALRQSRKTRP